MQRIETQNNSSSPTYFIVGVLIWRNLSSVILNDILNWFITFKSCHINVLIITFKPRLFCVFNFLIINFKKPAHLGADCHLCPKFVLNLKALLIF